MSAGVIAAHYAAGGATYRDEVLADAPLLYLRLDEAATGATAADSSGNGRGFTVVNATAATTAVLPGGGSAYDFNGTTARLERAHEAWMIPAAFTIEAWIKPDRVTGTQMGIWSKDNAPNGAALYVKNSKLVAWFQSTDAFGTTTLTAGQAYHAAMTFVGGTVTLYLDGQVDGTFGRSWNPPTSTMLIGCTTAGNGGSTRALFFDGQIDEVAYYGTALSSDRIAAHYAARASA